MATKFERICRTYMPRLINDLGVTVLDAAAVFGNGGHESGGFATLQEIKPTVKGSAGGYGWFQWTGDRRRAFTAFCKARLLKPSSDEANYLFLVHELTGSERAALAKLAAARTLDAKTVAFEMAYERAGIKHYPKRKAWALKALHIYEAMENPKPRPDANTPRLPDPAEVPIPEDRPVSIPGLDKPLPKSTTFWTTIVTTVSGVFGSLAYLDPLVQALLVAVIVAGGLWIIWERRRYGRAARKAGV